MLWNPAVEIAGLIWLGPALFLVTWFVLIEAVEQRVGALAKTIAEGEGALWPILADALCEVGEDGAADHCRQERHLQGCHVLDWILGLS